ncbi:hypothetical protein OH76DRAFT_1348811 [Lentinus brumalis]|uniref:DUF6697 domain-containing protein n=1 Tax=Lentinus brumalis TaxID=2498619 RepID=A0A371DCZ1_9APHY|nr:hypothetical protein OH76DRAFT_1348811 [Polyporus brumalis]
MDHNAWSPPGPGQHGYMQVGLGRDRKLFNGEGEYRHVFVGGGKFFLYCGWYHVLRVDPLTKEEWDTLPPRVKKTYAETTFNKENTKECTDKQLWSTIKNADQVLTMYNEGQLRAPLVRLQCLKFDMDFYQELVDANGRYFTNKARPAPPSVAKRRKASDDAMVEDDKEEDIPLAATVVQDKAQDDHPAMALDDCASAAAVPSQELMASSSSEHASMNVTVSAAPPPRVSANIAVPLSSPARQASTQPQSSSGLRLRIPGGRPVRSHSVAKDTEEEREVRDRLTSSTLSSLSDDDMYAD